MLDKHKSIKVSVLSVVKSTETGINKQTRQSYNTAVTAQRREVGVGRERCRGSLDPITWYLCVNK